MERNCVMDRITKFESKINGDNTVYSCSLRESGHFDIYWNMILIDSPSNVKVSDINLSFDSIYFQLQNGQVFTVDTIHGSAVGYNRCRQEGPDFEFPIIFY